MVLWWIGNAILLPANDAKYRGENFFPEDR
jgi:hypothetical protein